MTVVHAFANYTGCRNVTVSRVVKRLIIWEREHNCRIDVIYVNTLFNWADEPRYEDNCIKSFFCFKKPHNYIID